MSERTSVNVLTLITLQVTDFATLVTVSQVCRNWRRVVKQLLPELMAQLRFAPWFKVTRVRFLLDRERPEQYDCNPLQIHHQWDQNTTGQRPIFGVEIFSNSKELSVVLPLVFVNEDPRYFVYESTQVPPAWRLRVLKYRILWSQGELDQNGNQKWLPFRQQADDLGNWGYGSLERENGYQMVDADLSWQMFGTGRRYQEDDEQVVIGSTGGWNAFHCCCAIQLMSPGKREV
jgi:hypothetical protein